MDRLTRKELKRDAFAQEVGHTVEFFEQHRRQAIFYGSIALALIVLVAGYRWYSRGQHEVRQQELQAAMRIQEAAVAASNPRETVLTFATQEAKHAAAIKAFSDLATGHGGSDEGLIARYYLGVIAADQGKMEEAEKAFRNVADGGNKEYSTLGKFALSQVCQSRGKSAEAEKLLRSIIEKPSVLVSKEQATISLAELLAQSRPEEARKLLEPLRTQPGAVSRVALTALGAMPKK